MSEGQARIKLTLDGLSETVGDVKKLKGAFDSINAPKDLSRDLNKAEASARDLTKSLSSGDQAVRAISRRALELVGDLRKAANEATDLKKALSGVGDGLAAGFSFAITDRLLDVLVQIPQQVAASTLQFEKFNTVLTTTLGSQDAANETFAALKRFADETPFTIEGVTESFIKLINRGVVPTKSELTNLGDLASSQGKELDQLVEALLDAQTGENERLKEFGIQAQTVGDKVKFTFKGVTTEVAKTPEAIAQAITGFGKLEGVAGAMAAQSQTLGGKLSTLQGVASSAAAAFGQELSPSISKAVDELIGSGKETQDFAANAGKAVVEFVDETAEAVEKLDLEPVGELFNFATQGIKNLVAAIPQIITVLEPVIDFVGVAVGKIQELFVIAQTGIGNLTGGTGRSTEAVEAYRVSSDALVQESLNLRQKLKDNGDNITADQRKAVEGVVAALRSQRAELLAARGVAIGAENRSALDAQLAQIDKQIAAFGKYGKAGADSNKLVADGIIKTGQASDQTAKKVEADTVAMIKKRLELGEITQAEAVKELQAIVNSKSTEKNALSERAAAQQALTQIAKQAAAERVAAIQQELEIAKQVNEIEQGKLGLAQTDTKSQLDLLNAQLQTTQAVGQLEQEQLATKIAQAEAAGNTAEVEKLRAQSVELAKQQSDEEFAIKQKQLDLQIKLNDLQQKQATLAAELKVKEEEIAVQKAIAEGKSTQEVDLLKQQLDLAKQKLDLQKQQAGAQSQINGELQKQLNAEKAIADQNAAQQAIKKPETAASGGGISRPSRPGGGSSSSSSSESNSYLQALTKGGEQAGTTIQQAIAKGGEQAAATIQSGVQKTLQPDPQSPLGQFDAQLQTALSKGQQGAFANAAQTEEIMNRLDALTTLVGEGRISPEDYLKLNSLLGSKLGSSPRGLFTGGPVAPGEPVLVGERGPELFQPNTGGYVIPNQASAQLLAARAIQPITPVSTPSGGGSNTELIKAVDRLAEAYAKTPMQANFNYYNQQEKMQQTFDTLDVIRAIRRHV